MHFETFLVKSHAAAPTQSIPSNKSYHACLKSSFVVLKPLILSNYVWHNCSGGGRWMHFETFLVKSNAAAPTQSIPPKKSYHASLKVNAVVLKLLILSYVCLAEISGGGRWMHFETFLVKSHAAAPTQSIPSNKSYHALLKVTAVVLKLLILSYVCLAEFQRRWSVDAF